MVIAHQSSCSLEQRAIDRVHNERQTRPKRRQLKQARITHTQLLRTLREQNPKDAQYA